MLFSCSNMKFSSLVLNIVERRSSNHFYFMVFSILIELCFSKIPLLEYLLFFEVNLRFLYYCLYYAKHTLQPKRGEKSAFLQHFYKGWFRWRKRVKEYQLSCHHQLPVHFSILIYIQLFLHCSVFHFRIKWEKT